MAPRHSLSIYRIKEEIDREAVSDFDDMVQVGPGTRVYNLPDNHPLQARLFVDQPNISRPSWLDFLEEGFGEIEEIVETISHRAVLVIRIGAASDKYFAIPFGFGRYLLKPGSYVYNYGLKVALNAIYAQPQDGARQPSRIRSLDIKTVAANTLHTRRQTNRWANFETFGIDTKRDQLKRITGLPLDIDYWGSRVTGADPVRVNPEISFDDLGRILEAVEELYNKTTYREYFSWIDNVIAISDPTRQERLENILISLLQAKEIDQLELAPPEIVEWDDIGGFSYHPWTDRIFEDLNLADFLQVLDDEERLEELNLPRLKTYRVIAYDHQGQELNRWNAVNCLSGEIQLDNITYLIEDGEYYRVSQDYLEDLNQFISEIPISDIDLLVPGQKMLEGDYNIAASGTDDKLCLDKQTVQRSDRTTPVEICDILTDSGQYIHVKRKLRSAALSHLFYQGFVSAELLRSDPEYRTRVSEKVEEAEAEKFNIASNRFQAAVPEPFTAQGLEVVYCILAKWNDRAPEEAIPFFSKINLRQAYEELTRFGYTVSLAPIQGE
jgi:uncharacterized protein (TIGR04141 family)